MNLVERWPGAMAEMSRFEKFFVNRRGNRSFARLLDRVAAAGQLPLDPTSRVLELGAGNGGLSALLYERFRPAECRITDFDPRQLEVARKNLTKRFGALPPSLVLETADATHLPYPDSTFDLIVAHLMLHHLGRSEEIRKGIDEIARVLRPEGRFLYVEIFHREVPRDELTKCGFAFPYDRRGWRIFSTPDTVVALRVPPPSRPATPPGPGISPSSGMPG